MTNTSTFLHLFQIYLTLPKRWNAPPIIYEEKPIQVKHYLH